MVPYTVPVHDYYEPFPENARDLYYRSFGKCGSDNKDVKSDYYTFLIVFYQKFGRGEL